MKVPSELRESLETGWAGDAGFNWLDSLPRRLADAQQRWQVTIGVPYEPGGYTSYVAPAETTAGDDAVYKITIPHPEAVGEADALTAYASDGAVSVIEAEPQSFELLLERCVPGDSLWSVDSDAERLDIACALMARLWRPSTSTMIAHLDDVTAAWADVTARRLLSAREHGWATEPIERGIDLLRTLPAQATDRVLLHGDFHPGNILRAEREPWLVIDPKPMIGDPAFEPIQLLTQRNGQLADPPGPRAVETRLIGIAERVGLDAERIALWTIARTAEWSMWSWDHGDTADAALFHAWTRTIDGLVPPTRA